MMAAKRSVDASIENSPLLAVREYVADCLEGSLGHRTGL